MSSNGVQSVVRAMRILEAVGQASSGLGLRELGERLGLKPQTVHHLAATLESTGYVTKAGRPARYRLGPALRRLVADHDEIDWRRRTEHVVRGLAGEYPHATVSFAEDVAGDIALTLRMSPEQPGVVQRPREHLMSPYISASACVHHAFRPEAERLVYEQRYPFDEYGLNYWQDRERFDAFLDEVRGTGVAAPPRHRGLAPVAAAVFSADHALIGALGVAVSAASAASARALRTTLSQTLKQAAEEIAAEET